MADLPPPPPPPPGWWLASDGNWYPPNPTLAPTPLAPKRGPWQEFRGIPLLAQIASWVLLTLVVLVVIGLIAGSGEKKQDVAVVRSDASATPASVTTTTALTTTTEPTTTTTTTEPPTTAAPTTAAPTTAAPPVYLMPNIPCGTDLQAAQDRVQKAGVFYSRSEDATGQGRNQIIDSNWTVLSQDPAPGTPISEGDPVFYVVKDTEFSGC